MSRHRRAQDAGFTLLEMLAALAILGAATGIALIHGIGAPRSIPLRDAARTVAGQFRIARGQAIISGQAATVALDLDTGTVRRSGAPPLVLRGITLHRPDAAPIDGDAPESGIVIMTFLPDGGARGGGIVLAAGQAAIRITAERLTGRIDAVP